MITVSVLVQFHQDYPVNTLNIIQIQTKTLITIMFSYFESASIHEIHSNLVSKYFAKQVNMEEVWSFCKSDRALPLPLKFYCEHK